MKPSNHYYYEYISTFNTFVMKIIKHNLKLHYLMKPLILPIINNK